MNEAERFLGWLNSNRPQEAHIAKSAMSKELRKLIGMEDSGMSCQFMGVMITVKPDFWIGKS